MEPRQQSICGGLCQTLYLLQVTAVVVIEASLITSFMVNVDTRILQRTTVTRTTTTTKKIRTALSAMVLFYLISTLIVAVALVVPGSKRSSVN